MKVEIYPHKSIRKQFIVIFFLILAGAIGLCILLNETLLTKYYFANKRMMLKAAYRSLNIASAEGNMESDDFKIEVQRISGIYNISILIIDPDSQVIVSSEHENKRLIFELQQYIFDLFPEEDDGIAIIEEETDYTIQKSYDNRTGINYLEMWGFLENGNPFLVRTAVEGIEDSVKISNRFLIYAGLLAFAAGVICICIVTTQITRPIRQLADISRRMANLDFNARYEGNARDEIGKLGNDMNRLSERLEKTISELKSANIELQRDIEKREELDGMRSDFISNVSHELKTPLALIMGYAEGLKMDVNDDPESREYYCDVISDEAEKMNQMVKELLTLNQLEFGNDPVPMERFDIAELIRNYIQSAKILTEAAGVTVIFEQTQPVCVWGDEFKVEEVLENFFSNAMHYVSGKKEIRISICQKDDCARISVFNTGEPIPEESLEHLWEKFYKVDKARTREYGGSGIGLSIVKAIMESMNQKYGVINHSDGVEFWFELETKS